MRVGLCVRSSSSSLFFDLEPAGELFEDVAHHSEDTATSPRVTLCITFTISAAGFP